MLKYVVACLNMIDVRRIVLVAVFKWQVLIILAFVVFFGVSVLNLCHVDPYRMIVLSLIIYVFIILGVAIILCVIRCQ